MAATHGEHCAACLLEKAFENVRDEPREAARRLTLYVPLGETATTRVFLVKSEGSPSRLLRLKVWRRCAAEGFLVRFHRLQSELDSWVAEGIDRPLAARIDATGCPSVLTEFSRGVPILDRVKAGRLDRNDAIARLPPLLKMVERAHARGLAHGSIVPGNVIVNVESSQARLLDFGLTPLMAISEDRVALASADLAGFAALSRTLQALPISPEPSRNL